MTTSARQPRALGRPTVRRRLGVLLIAVCGLSACDRATKPSQNPTSSSVQRPASEATAATNATDADQPNPTHKQENNQVTTLTVSKRTGRAEETLGTISFDGNKPAQLALENNGPEAEKLRSKWEKVSAKEKLPMEVKETVGEVIEMNVELISKEDARYPYAVWSYLESQYGYVVDEEQN